MVEIPLSTCKFIWSEESDPRSIIDDMNTDLNATGNRYRFIHESVIMEILIDELKSDLYILGCFNADFLAGITGWPSDMIRAVQDAEKFESLGESLLEFVDEIAESYSSIDGFGHHFASYDGNETELAGEWSAFQIG